MKPHYTVGAGDGEAAENTIRWSRPISQFNENLRVVPDPGCCPFLSLITGHVSEALQPR